MQSSNPIRFLLNIDEQSPLTLRAFYNFLIFLGVISPLKYRFGEPSTQLGIAARNKAGLW